MSKQSNGDVLFVGSVPGDNAEDVFQLCAGAAGTHAYAFPDGEFGPRQMWIGALGDMVFSKHPDLERLPDAEMRFFGTYGVRDGVEEVSFAELYPYTDFALESYATFSRLRESGTLPAGSRFQVSLPTPFAAIPTYFSDLDRTPGLMQAWADAMREGYDRMLQEIPAEDLVIQLDYCVELVPILGIAMNRTNETAEQALQRYTGPEYTASMTENLPDAVGLGYHICLGTYPRRPMVPQEDLTNVVRIANGLIENTPRSVDYLHLPVVDEAGDAFFAPLRDLKPGPKVFLGVDCGDGADELRRRIEAAKPHIDAFGVAHFCGYGREDAHRIDELLGDLVTGAEAH